MKETLSFFLKDEDKKLLQNLARDRFLNLSSFVKTIVMSTDFKNLKIQKLSKIKDYADTVSITGDTRIYNIVKRESEIKEVSVSTILTSVILNFKEELKNEKS